LQGAASTKVCLSKLWLLLLVVLIELEVVVWRVLARREQKGLLVIVVLGLIDLLELVQLLQLVLGC